MHYYRAKTFYAEEDYEAALRSVTAALQAKPKNEEFTSLRTNIIISLYRSYGLPAIALHHLSHDGCHAISHIAFLKKRKTLMSEINRKFAVPIVMRFSDSVLETDRKFIRSAIVDTLRGASAGRFYNLSLIEQPDASASVVLEVSLEDFAVTETKGEPKSLWSEYESGLITQPNPEYLRLVVALRGLIARQEHLAHVRSTPGQRLHWDAEHFVLTETMEQIRMRIKKKSAELASTPSHLTRPAFTTYQFLERDTVLDVEMILKYRIVDSYHRFVWKDETVRYADTTIFKEISNIHPEDVTGMKNQKITEEELRESLAATRRQMYSELAEKVGEEIARIHYYRARDYQALGLHADAWEHYYAFLKTLPAGEKKEEISEEAEFIVNQDPLKFPLTRGNKIPSDRNPPTIGSYGSDS
jgi:hypothetical protein